MFFNVLDVLTKNKKIWCFDSKFLVVFHKVLSGVGRCVFLIITRYGHPTYFSNTIPITFSTILYDFAFSTKTNPPLILVKTGHPFNGVLLGLLCN